MIKEKGVAVVKAGRIQIQELDKDPSRIPDGEYQFWMFDENRNPLLPQLKYLNGIVLKTISDRLPDHPTVGALYRYFEQLYAPRHVCEIAGHRFEYCDLKNEKSVEMDVVIGRIIRHAAEVWRIEIEERPALSAPEEKEAWLDAYTDMWKNCTTIH